MKGAFAENLAVKFLEKNGYEIIKRNLKIFNKEIDIVVRKNDEISAVEVKYRKNINFLSVKTKQIENISTVMSIFFPESFFNIYFIFVDENFKIYFSKV